MSAELTSSKKQGQVKKPSTTKHESMVESKAITFDELTKIAPHMPHKHSTTYLVRKAFMYTLLEYLVEGRQDVSMQDVWRRMCYQRSWVSGQVLRRVYQQHDGTPKDFMWGWPLSLFLHYMLGVRITRTTSSYRIRSKDSVLAAWLLEPIVDRLNKQRAHQLNVQQANRLEFAWQCHRLKLEALQVRQQHAELYAASGVQGKSLLTTGSLDWLRYIEKG